MTFKKSDLFDIYCTRRDKILSDATLMNKSLGFVTFCIQWESYTEALVDFGIINNKERKKLLELTSSFP